jgi:hypothetical protein
VPWTTDGGHPTDVFGEEYVDSDTFTLDGDDVPTGTSHLSEWAKRREYVNGTIRIRKRSNRRV